MILKNSIIIAFFSVLSVLLGVVRDRLLATHIGVGSTLDMYNAAFRLPDLVYAFSIAFVTSGTIVPFLTVEDKTGTIEDPRKKLSSIFLFVGGMLTIISIGIAITIPWYAKFIVPGFDDSQITTFVSVTRLLLIQPIILGLTSLISCFAQLKNHFILYGIAPLGYSLGIIISIPYLYPLYGVHGLIYGVLGGALLSFCIQAISLRKAHIHEVLFYFSWSHIKELVHLGLPRTGLNIMTQIRNIVFTGFATVLGAGVLSSYLFAQRIIDAVIQIIQQSVTTASIPILSRDIVEGKKEEYAHTVKRYVLGLGGVGVIIASGLFLLRSDVVAVLYGTSSENGMITFFLTGLLCTIPLHMMTGYLVISLYSQKDTKSVFFAGFTSSCFGIIVAYVTLPQGPKSIIYGMLTAVSVSFLIVFLLYSRKRRLS